MQTLTINILNTEAKKVIDDLVDKNFITIEAEENSAYKWYEDEEFVKELERRSDEYDKNPDANKTWEEVQELILLRSEKNSL